MAGPPAAYHPDFPHELADDLWDTIAKVLLLRAGGNVTIGFDEFQAAAQTPCELRVETDDRTICMRVRGN